MRRSQEAFNSPQLPSAIAVFCLQQTTSTLSHVKRINAKVTEVDASHAVFMTQPKVVADVIDQAAKAVD